MLLATSPALASSPAADSARNHGQRDLPGPVQGHPHRRRRDARPGPGDRAAMGQHGPDRPHGRARGAQGPRAPARLARGQLHHRRRARHRRRGGDRDALAVVLVEVHVVEQQTLAGRVRPSGGADPDADAGGREMTGQPLHTYDAATLSGTVVARQAARGRARCASTQRSSVATSTGFVR